MHGAWPWHSGEAAIDDPWSYSVIYLRPCLQWGWNPGLMLREEWQLSWFLRPLSNAHIHEQTDGHMHTWIPNEFNHEFVTDCPLDSTFRWKSQRLPWTQEKPASYLFIQETFRRLLSGNSRPRIEQPSPLNVYSLDFCEECEQGHLTEKLRFWGAPHVGEVTWLWCWPPFPSPRSVHTLHI